MCKPRRVLGCAHVCTYMWTHTLTQTGSSPRHCCMQGASNAGGECVQLILCCLLENWVTVLGPERPLCTTRLLSIHLEGLWSMRLPAAPSLQILAEGPKVVLAAALWL